MIGQQIVREEGRIEDWWSRGDGNQMVFGGRTGVMTEGRQREGKSQERSH